MNNEADSLLNKRRSRRQVLASLGLGAAALYVAPTLISMGQAEAREHHHSRSSYSRPSYSRPSYSRPSYSKSRHSRPRYSRPYYSRPQRSRWERDGVIEIRISRLLPRW
ncbi:hypothetical protein [Halomonas sp. TD01]|uniref:hypothetical protein n=1 Tax=Halomonas sp. TD01 TaxID=999141 RepID=UPI000214F9E3|nr:hypothetical protein [Halomonas sp. TD01]EGP18192.1 hypothetical protein GME_17007 [Halomonas sp. TD01]CAH1044352.1 hypothetical protein HPTD01_2830 [Halomonas sp. TD01]